MAGAVPGAAWSQSSPAHVSPVRGRSDRTRRPQECGADGGALGSWGLRPIAPFHFRRRVGRDASGGGTRPPRRSSGRWRSGGVGRRRYGVAEEGFAFGRRRAAIRLRVGQDGQLPGAGVADARAERSSRHDRPAFVFAGELDRRRGSADQGGRARGGARGALQARDRAQRNRSRPCSRLSFRLGGGGPRIRSFRRLPTGAGRPQTHLGGRRSKTSEGLSRRRRTGLSGRRTWTPAQATYPGPALLVGGRDVGASEMASHQSEKGTKGSMAASFAAIRVRVADGAPQRIHDKGMQHMPGAEAWLVGERRASGERKYYLSNLSADVSLKTLAAAIKARWVCEQAHQQLKEELGLDHFEGRSWRGMHRHALMTMIAYAYLQSRRLAAASGGKKNPPRTAQADTARDPARRARHSRSRAAISMSLLQANRPKTPRINLPK